jgi:hypothetical protein
MIKELVVESTKKFIFFVAKKGISDQFSPETIVTGRTLDYKKHCRYEFGEYVQADTYTEPRNDMRERTLDAIYLAPNDNDQGGHILMDLTTGSRITRDRIHPCPMTLLIQNQVETLAKNQGIINVKFTNKKGETLEHADWIAGVDYDVLGTEEMEPTDDDNDEDDVTIENIVQVANPNHGELVEDEEEPEKPEEPDDRPEDDLMQETLDEIIDELNTEIIPAGETLLRDVTEVETVHEDTEEDDPVDDTEDPVERLIRPH